MATYSCSDPTKCGSHIRKSIRSMPPAQAMHLLPALRSDSQKIAHSARLRGSAVWPPPSRPHASARRRDYRAARKSTSSSARSVATTNEIVARWLLHEDRGALGGAAQAALE